jgi:hypothetical protein
VAFFGHAVGESNDDLKALIGAAENFPRPGFLIPTRNGDLMRCLAEGLRIMQTMTLMTIGQRTYLGRPPLAVILLGYRTWRPAWKS